jgi:hypothetical protein
MLHQKLTDFHTRCPRCGFVVDELVLSDIVEHLCPHDGVPWRAWLRSPRRAWQAATDGHKGPYGSRL